MWGRAPSTWRGPMRSSGVRPSYRTKASCLLSVAVMCAPRWKGSLRSIDALEGQATFGPVLLAATVQEDRLVSQLLEAPSHEVGAGPDAAAVHDDVGVEVGEQCGRELVDLPGWDVDGSREVGVRVVGGPECLDHDGPVGGGEAAEQDLTGDRGRHG